MKNGRLTKYVIFSVVLLKQAALECAVLALYEGYNKVNLQIELVNAFKNMISLFT